MGEAESGPRGFELVDDDQEKQSKVSPESDSSPGAGEALPPITFGAFVLSLGTSAAVHLGIAPVPGGQEKPKPNLALAKQTIDILSMVEEKTQGNLNEDERRLLESVLHDLRMRFVEARKQEG
jgi:hypothetical protein